MHDILTCDIQNFNILTTDTYLTTNARVASLILTTSHTFVEIDHEIISANILLPSVEIQEGLLSVTSESM